MTFAIVRTGGKQYKVAEGQTLRIEKVPVKEGDVLDMDVLLVADGEGKAVQIGQPVLTGAKVTARVVSHGVGDKVSVVKYKPKTRYKRRVGHRQPETMVKIEKIA
ncbi:50S ribosomal protein L21 [Patescibacteria group bacterium]|nr:MAG: 50S ribosomal protein L21 [Patescibacteria group bacterium]